jgi:hypothetical protein
MHLPAMRAEVLALLAFLVQKVQILTAEELRARAIPFNTRRPTNKEVYLKCLPLE